MTQLQTKSLPTQAKLLYVFTQSAYSNATGQEGLDAVLVGAAFEQTVSLLFLYDGIYQLKADQDMQASGIKQYTKTFQALADYDVENIYDMTDREMIGHTWEMRNTGLTCIDCQDVQKYYNENEISEAEDAMEKVNEELKESGDNIEQEIERLEQKLKSLKYK
jgi:tRNA 2-thiouridine synthesizing protein C